MLLQTLLQRCIKPIVPEHLKLLPREVHATYFLERIGNPASHSLLRKLSPYKMQVIGVNYWSFCRSLVTPVCRVIGVTKAGK